MSLFNSDADNPTGQHASATSGAHGLIGACLMVLALWAGQDAYIAAWGISGAYLLCKELLFDVWRDRRARVLLDSLLDTAMIGIGCALIYGLNPVVDGYDAMLAAGLLAILGFIVFADRWRK